MLLCEAEEQAMAPYYIDNRLADALQEARAYFEAEADGWDDVELICKLVHRALDLQRQLSAARPPEPQRPTPQVRYGRL